jgi:hypothetical protein
MISFTFLSSCDLLYLSFHHTAYFNDIVVGGVCCREDRMEGARKLYIMTLGCLAPYRRLGIGRRTLHDIECAPHVPFQMAGTVMLEHVLSLCEQDGQYASVFL